MTSLRHRFRTRFAVITALAILIAQLGAMAHAYTHIPQAKPVSAQQQAGTGVHDFCGDCLNFAPLLAAGGTPAALPSIAPAAQIFAKLAAFVSFTDHTPRLAFRSRAPPVTR